MTGTPPSPEVKAIIRKFVQVQIAKYGPDWKKKLSTEMVAKTTPVILALLKSMKKN